jgi:carbon-monoxide dehydrogenase iron sulfur subunit
MKIRVENERCSGCHLCEMVCSLFHSGAINVEKSAIRIDKDDLDSSLNSPILCRQCKEMKCLGGEKADEALEKKKFTWGAVRAKRCPFHALPIFGEKVYHCDLCGGKPQCVKVCTPGAITVSTFLALSMAVTAIFAVLTSIS